jgi:hypothetical protein
MESTLKILNEMEGAGLVTRHAIGGAMAAYFYSEAVVTEDLDVFVLLATAPGLITLTPIYDFLKGRGATERREHLVIAGTLVQIIPSYDSLTREAVEQALQRQVGGTPMRVMRAEHLIAIALKTGRAKDHARVAMMLEETEVDAATLTDILQRHELLEKWKQFKTTVE